jgi:hypothetical protein
MLPAALTRRDLVTLAEFFGFRSAEEFAAFLQQQDEMASGREVVNA